jgi:hypothetical protein
MSPDDPKEVVRRGYDAAGAVAGSGAGGAEARHQPDQQVYHQEPEQAQSE